MRTKADVHRLIELYTCESLRNFTNLSTAQNWHKTTSCNKNLFLVVM
jgi:hypothetical protein